MSALRALAEGPLQDWEGMPQGLGPDDVDLGAGTSRRPRDSGRTARDRTHLPGDRVRAVRRHRLVRGRRRPDRRDPGAAARRAARGVRSARPTGSESLLGSTRRAARRGAPRPGHAHPVRHRRGLPPLRVRAVHARRVDGRSAEPRGATPDTAGIAHRGAPVRRPLPRHRSALPAGRQPGLPARAVHGRGLPRADRRARHRGRDGGVRVLPGLRPDLPARRAAHGSAPASSA